MSGVVKEPDSILKDSSKTCAIGNTEMLEKARVDSDTQPTGDQKAKSDGVDSLAAAEAAVSNRTEESLAIAESMLGQPGAYACAHFVPGGTDTELTSTRDEEQSLANSQHQPTNPVSNDGLVVAIEVAEDEENANRERLPRAVLEASRGSQEREKVVRDRTIIVAICGWLLIMAVVCTLSLALPNGGKGLQDDHNNDHVNTASPPPTAPDGVRDTLIGMLPNYTLRELGDPDSPQSKAFEWISGDPNLPAYIVGKRQVLQRFSLATFYYATGGDSWQRNDNWLSYEHHECEWYGGPSFELPIHLGGIQLIDPPYWTPCELPPANDTVKDSANSILEYGRPYKHLWMSANRMHGKLPLELFWLTSLRSLSLSRNDLSGTIPTYIGQLKNLEELSLGSNSFSGSLPTQLSSLYNLRGIHAPRNAFTGAIPSELGILPLKYLSLNVNAFNSTIPSEIFSMPADYAVLLLFANRLTGSLPTEIGNLGDTSTLNFASNSLNGTIPSEIGRMGGTRVLTFADNYISGSIPTEIGQLTWNQNPLRSSPFALDFTTNRLTGTIPSEIGLLKNLGYFLATGNQLSGTIPEEVKALTQSQAVRIFNVTSNDQLAGSLSATNGLCFTNATYFDTDCWATNVMQRPPHCGCLCSCD